jgi:Ca2+/Na+ antiporter
MTMKNDSLSTKIKVLIVSIILVAGVIIVYSIDKEQSWGIEKIISCVLLSFYAFFFTND